MEESDEEAEKPGLDEQIKMLEEEIIKPSVQKEFNLSPQIVQAAVPPSPKKESGSAGSGLKSVLLSLAIVLLLSVIFFYLIFFSPIQHPFISKIREHLEFLEPVRDFVARKANDVASYFKWAMSTVETYKYLHFFTLEKISFLKGFLRQASAYTGDGELNLCIGVIFCFIS